MERLTTAQHKLAEAMYAKAARPGAGAPGDGGAGADNGSTTEKPGGRDDVVDADFEEVKE